WPYRSCDLQADQPVNDTARGGKTHGSGAANPRRRPASAAPLLPGRGNVGLLHRFFEVRLAIEELVGVGEVPGVDRAPVLQPGTVDQGPQVALDGALHRLERGGLGFDEHDVGRVATGRYGVVEHELAFLVVFTRQRRPHLAADADVAWRVDVLQHDERFEVLAAVLQPLLVRRQEIPHLLVDLARAAGLAGEDVEIPEGEQRVFLRLPGRLRVVLRDAHRAFQVHLAGADRRRMVEGGIDVADVQVRLAEAGERRDQLERVLALVILDDVDDLAPGVTLLLEQLQPVLPVRLLLQHRDDLHAVEWLAARLQPEDDLREG